MIVTSLYKTYVVALGESAWLGEVAFIEEVTDGVDVIYKMTLRNARNLGWVTASPAQRFADAAVSIPNRRDGHSKVVPDVWLTDIDTILVCSEELQTHLLNEDTD